MPNKVKTWRVPVHPVRPERALVSWHDVRHQDPTLCRRTGLCPGTGRGPVPNNLPPNQQVAGGFMESELPGHGQVHWAQERIVPFFCFQQPGRGFFESPLHLHAGFRRCRAWPCGPPKMMKTVRSRPLCRAGRSVTCPTRGFRPCPRVELPRSMDTLL